MANEPVLLYYDDGTTESYQMRSLSWQLEKDTGVAIVHFDNEASLNPLTENLFGEIFVVLEHAKRDPAVKALVWAGKGRAWSAGAALKDDRKCHVPKRAQKEYKKRGIWRETRDIALKKQTLLFWDFPKPAIAAVQGMAVGGAANMAFCNYFDLVYVSDDSKFKYPFVKLGLTAELGSSKMLPLLIGYPKAKELLLLGEWFTGHDAERLGLCNKVVPRAELLGVAVNAARQLAAAKIPTAVTLGKRIVNSHLRAEMERVMDEENKTIWEAVRSAGRNSLLGGGGGDAKKKSKL